MVLITVGLFVAASPLFALDPSMTNTQYGLSFWMSDHGLPQNSVYALAQTTDGYLWLGTEEGLARFDGVRFTTYLEHRTTHALLASRDGSLWIAVGSGIARYKDGQLRHYSTRDGLRDGVVYSLSEGVDGTIWMATRSGLNRYQQGKFNTFIITDASAPTWILSTCVTRDGAFWWGTNGNGLNRLRNGVITTFTARDGLSDNVVSSIYQDRQGDLWIGGNSGLNRMHEGKITTFSIADGLTSHRVKRIQEDRDGNLWIGTEGGGVNRYSHGKFSSFGTKHRLSHATVLSLLEDQEGSLWVGTSGEGLSQLRPGKFKTLGRSEGLNGDLVWSVREARDGSLLVGTSRGFSRWKDGAMTNVTVSDGLSSDGIRSVMEDRTGAIWLGTNAGVNRYAHGKVTVYRTSDGLSDSTVRVTTEDRHGNVWIGTRGGGLVRYRNGAFTVFNTKDGLAGNVIASVDEAPDGSLWIGSDGGISVFQDGVFTNYSVREGLSSNSVRVTYHDRQGGHWVGTYGGGINRIKDGRITPITVKDGLFNEVAYAIVEDRKGYLWMTCNRGIYRVSLHELNAFADGKIRRIHSTAFDAADGMKAAECNGGSPGAWAGRDGRLYFATVKGVAIIDPNRMVLNTHPPPVWNEEVLLDGKLQSASRNGFAVGPGRHSLEIHYTALSFVSPSAVRFRYRLRGFSDVWVEAGDRRTAFYTNLPPGDYTFEVMGSNNDGVWKQAGNPLLFHFQAAFYQTAWFRIACGICLLLAIWTAFRVRVRLLRERERRLVTRVAEQTAELSIGKAAAEAVAAINTQLRLENELILNSIADGVFAVDPSGNISAENPAASRMLGWSRMELIGRSIHESILHSTLTGPRSRNDCPLDKTLADGVLRQVSDEVFWRKDGTSVPVDYLVAPILDSKERVTGVAITFRDVTQQKAIERLKGEFVSTVSHELRTPLTSIRGALGLLSSGVLGPIADKGQRMLEIAVSNTDRLVRLINDILDLERIESGKVELTLASVDANTVMVQTAEGLQSIADQAGVRVVVVPATEAIRGDSDRIIQTLTNLLGNAIKFSPRDTTVTLSGTAGDVEFTFCVADEGRGVPKQKLDTIFERFSQVNASDSRDKGGSGLGLAICKSIVDAHGGRIWAEMNDPKGSRFQFTIPLAVASSVVPPELADEIQSTCSVSSTHLGGLPLILVVEDDLDLARVMTTALQRHGIRTLHVTNGRDAIRSSRQYEPNLIVLDIGLPDMDGYTVVAALRENARLARVPLLVYSALDVGAADQARLRLGPTEFLTKSRCSLADFEKHVVRLLGAVTRLAKGTQHAA